MLCAFNKVSPVTIDNKISNYEMFYCHKIDKQDVYMVFLDNKDEYQTMNSTYPCTNNNSKKII